MQTQQSIWCRRRILPVSWPKNGVVLVFCKGGKYWADLVCDDLSDAQEVLDSLKGQAKQQQKQELLDACGKQVIRRRLQLN